MTAYDVTLDLAADEETFASTTVVRFVSRGGETFCDVSPRALRRVRLNGSDLDVAALEAEVQRGGRFTLPTQAGENELVVDAVMGFRSDGEGLHAHTDPADGRRYVYGMSFMDAAPSIFACFDQPDLKAPYTFHVRAPKDWVVVGNAPGEQVEPGGWEFEPTPPLSTYFVTLVAGPYHVITDNHDGIPLGLSARQSLADDLDREADELLTLTRQCFDEFHRLFGIRYPFGAYHQAFVPEFNAGAMENPGCVTFRDPLVFASRVTRGARIQRATTVAHEMAHQWFGNLTTPVWWDDLWLNESFAEYLGNRVTADVTEYADAWTHHAHSRRQWGLVADQRPSTHPVAGNGATDAASALQDFDGISYVKGSSILKQFAATLGDEAFFGGVGEHLTRHRFGNATLADLVGSWERAAGRDLGDLTTAWLRTAGPDTLRFDRAAGVVRRDPPAADPAQRRHTLQVAVAATQGPWRVSPLVVAEPATDLAVPAGEAVVIDPFEDSWALVIPDEVTVAALPSLLPATTDAHLRAGLWNGLRSALHNAEVSPAAVLEVLAAAVPVEDTDAALGAVLPWATGKLAPLHTDHAEALTRIREACAARLATAAPGSTLQLAAFQGLVRATADTAVLRGWLDGGDPADGLVIDLDLRWRVLVQLAVAGGIDRTELDQRLSDDPTSIAPVEHARARAALPDPEAKAWAWSHFTGERTGSNYQIQAIGQGLWQRGQEELTAPYVDRYFHDLDGAADHFSGWLLADAAEAFFPLTALDPSTVERARDAAARPDLPTPVRRRVGDVADELARRLAVRTRYARP